MLAEPVCMAAAGHRPQVSLLAQGLQGLESLTAPAGIVLWLGIAGGCSAAGSLPSQPAERISRPSHACLWAELP